MLCAYSLRDTGNASTLHDHVFSQTDGQDTATINHLGVLKAHYDENITPKGGGGATHFGSGFVSGDAYYGFIGEWSM